MSTKIYNGYRLPEMELRELHAFMRDFQKPMIAEAQRLYGSYVVERAVTLFDDYCRTGKWIDTIRSSSPMSRATMDIMDEQRESRRDGLRCMYDYECEVSVIPADGYLLAMIFTEQSKLRDIWDASETTEDFPYWNNTDCPDDMTEEQWDKRGDIWDKALEHSTPAMRGMSFTLCGRYNTGLFVDNSDIDGFIATFDSRVEKRTIAEYANQKAMEASDGREAMSLVMTAVSEAKKNPGLVKDLKKEVTEMLVPDLTFANLRERIEATEKKERE